MKIKLLFNKQFNAFLVKKIANQLICDRKNVLYINDKFMLTKDQMNSIDTIEKIKNGQTIKDVIKRVFGMEDPFTHDEIEKNQYIINGYMQVCNILYSCSYYNPKIVLIENFDSHLHPLTAQALIAYLKHDKSFIISSSSYNSKYYNISIEEIQSDEEINQIVKTIKEEIINESN